MIRDWVRRFRAWVWPGEASEGAVETLPERVSELETQLRAMAERLQETEARLAEAARRLDETQRAALDLTLKVGALRDAERSGRTRRLQRVLHAVQDVPALLTSPADATPPAEFP